SRNPQSRWVMDARRPCAESIAHFVGQTRLRYGKTDDLSVCLCYKLNTVLIKADGVVPTHRRRALRLRLLSSVGQAAYPLGAGYPDARLHATFHWERLSVTNRSEVNWLRIQLSPFQSTF